MKSVAAFHSILPAFLALASYGHCAAEFVDPSKSIPFAQLGAEAGKDYRGDGLSVTPVEGGAELRCDFQKLRGHVACEGLWLESTTPETTGQPFRIVAQGYGRETLKLLPASGELETAPSHARFIRPGVTEEYSVSVDGVRQDFLINEKPGGMGSLRVELAVDGAQAESAPSGVNLTLGTTGRRLAYQRLNVSDAVGQSLSARIEVISASRLALVVDDGRATYPLRIDPTFSDANWTSLNSGLEGTNYAVSAAIVDTSGNLYIGGRFTIAGTVAAKHIAKWNGSTWSVLGLGMSGSTTPAYDNVDVTALAVSGTTLYAAGWFTTAGGVPAKNIAKWNGSTWSALGSGLDGSISDYGNNVEVTALAVIGTNLYAAGSFTTAGGVAVSNIAKWNGSTWSALGSGTDGEVTALAVSGTNLYAAGRFSTAGGVAVSHIAKWNGSTWSALGSGIIGTVKALAVIGTDLYAGGEFNTAGGVAVNHLAKWNGSTWSALGARVYNDDEYKVTVLAVFGTNLYVGSKYGMPLGHDDYMITKWDGNSWSTLGYGHYGSIYALAGSGTTLYAGGDFSNGIGAATGIAYPVVVKNIVKCDDVDLNPYVGWSSLGSLMDADVAALAVVGADLYVGGHFQAVGGVEARHIAKWNGSSWSALGDGMYEPVHALAVIGSDLYAGGGMDPDSFEGPSTQNIAKWNGSTWSVLGSGIQGSSPHVNHEVVKVYALAVSGTTLYAGGSFITAGGVPAKNIAKWNGSTWSALGSGMDRTVLALAVSGSDLYAGGGFTTAGGVAVSNIAKWSGSTWSALGSGTDKAVSALAVSGTDLYAGGWFTTAGGVTANQIAKWNGSTWSALGSGISGPPWACVQALALSGTDLYAAGSFTAAGGVAANNIAKWNGSTWSALGLGMSGYNLVYKLSVVALACDTRGHLFAGGTFWQAGTTVSNNIAQANLPTVPDISVSQASVLIDSDSSIDFGTVDPGSSSAAKTFTITNISTTDLTGLAVTKDGMNAADFVIDTLGATSLTVGTGTSFAVTFNPAASGPLTTAIHIVSNGLTRKVFNINLTGTGTLRSPSVTTEAASGITASGATMNGTVNPNGLASTAKFEYGLSASYGGTVSVLLSPDNGSSGQAVSASLSGLLPGTTYHYHLSATNSGGTSPGADMQFVTAGTPPVITWANPRAISYGTRLSATQLNAKANVAGIWVYTPAAGTLLSVGKGQTLTADFTPTDTTRYGNAQQSVKIDVTQGKQTITFPAPPPLRFGDPDYPLPPIAPSGLPVSYTSSAPAVATIVDDNKLHIVGAGKVTITASQGGDSNWSPAANVPKALTIGKKNQTITFAAFGNHTVGDPDFDPGATATSGLTVTYTSAGTKVAAMVTGKIHLVGKGTAVITASQAGSGNYDKALAVKQTLTVAGKPQTITFPALPEKRYGDADFAPGATTTSGLALTYVSKNTKVATIVSGKIHITGIGTSAITAKQPGNAIWDAATDASQTLTVVKGTPVVAWENPKPITAGTALTATQLNAKANVPGKMVYTPTPGSKLSTGPQTLNVVFTPTDTARYNTLAASVTLTVNPAAGTLVTQGAEPSISAALARRYNKAQPIDATAQVDDADIRAFYVEMTGRIEAHDVAGFLKLFAPDYLHQGQCLEDQFDGDADMLDGVESFTFDITNILATGYDAVVSGDFTFTFDDSDATDETWLEPDLNDQSPGIGWLRRTPNGWRVIGDQYPPD